jgi:hypothetical protein
MTLHDSMYDTTHMIPTYRNTTHSVIVICGFSMEDAQAHVNQTISNVQRTHACVLVELRYSAVVVAGFYTKDQD